MLRWILILGSLLSGAVLLGVLASTYHVSEFALVVLVAFTALSVMGIIFRRHKWVQSS